MARRIGSGRTGKQILGNIFTDGTSIKSVIDDADLILDPNDGDTNQTGVIQVLADIELSGQTSTKYFGATGSNSISVRAPNTVTGNVTLTLPDSTGSSNQVLVTDGSGNLSFATSSIGIQNQTADPAPWYPLLANADSGSVSSVTTSSSKLEYQPSSGTLTTTQSRVSSSTASNSTTTGALVVTGGTGIGGNLYVGGVVRFTDTTASGGTSSGAVVISGGLGVNGALNAISKSFDIVHPLNAEKRLRHGSLEGPEFGVYYRGRLTNSNVIELPDYWEALVHDDTITVSLTPIGRQQNLWIKEISNNNILVEGDTEIDSYFVVYGERKDIAKLAPEG